MPSTIVLLLQTTLIQHYMDLVSIGLELQISLFALIKTSRRFALMDFQHSHQIFIKSLRIWRSLCNLTFKVMIVLQPQATLLNFLMKVH
jgi:hypothetical protein